MTIPLDGEGRFEAVDESDTVVGEGRVENGAVEFRYGEAHPDTGERPHVYVVPEPEFEASWEANPFARNLTLRAAGG